MRSVVLSVVVAFCGVAASAQTVANSMRFGYTGTVTRYATIFDAQKSVNAVATGTLSGALSRDFCMKFSRDSGSDHLLLGTGWFLTTTGPDKGNGNPSNKNTGFVQLQDNSLASLTPGAVNSKWDNARTTFTLNLSGTNALDGTHPQYNTRLWNTTADSGQGGTFLDYDFSMVATVADAAVWDAAQGMYISNTDPTSVTGYFRGLFQNTSEVPGSIGTLHQGYYVFDFGLNLDSWAYDNRALFDAVTGLTENKYEVSKFGSAIPESSTYALLLGMASLATVGLLRWRRRR